MIATTRVSQATVSKVVTFYKNGDVFFRGQRMAITPRRFRNMESLYKELNRLMDLPLGARYVLTKTGKTVESLEQLENGQGYICSSFRKLKDLNYGATDHFPYWNSAKQSPHKPAKVQPHSTNIGTVKRRISGEERLPRKISETFKPRNILVVRYGQKPRKVMKVLLNKRTAHTFDQVLDEITNSFGVWGTNGVRRLYNMKGKRMNNVSDLFQQEEDCFIAVGNERVQLSDFDEIRETTQLQKQHGAAGPHKTKLPPISNNYNNNTTQEHDLSQIADKHKPTTHKVSKSRNSVKLPVIARKSVVNNQTGNGPNQDSTSKPASKDTDNTTKHNVCISDSQPLSSGTHAISHVQKTRNVNEIKDIDKLSGNKKSVDLTNTISDEKNALAISRNVEDVYILGEKIGDGNFAVVRIGTEKHTSAKYALKIIDRRKVKGKEDMLQDEIRIMKSCDHVNIARLYETYETMFDIYLVMELVNGGDLFDEISNFVKFEEPVASSFARDIVNSLNYLHQRHIVHRDVKPENLLVHVNGSGKKQLKLADFGLAVEVATPLFTVCGTPTYVAPEILEETGYGLKVDVWAAGVIVYIMLCGFPPFRSPNKDQDELFDLIVAGDYEFLSPYWDGVSTTAKDLVKHLLVVDTKQRYTAEQILHHPWLHQDYALGVSNNAANAMRTSQHNFDAKRKFKGAAIAVKGSRKFQNIANEFQLKRDEKLIA